MFRTENVGSAKDSELTEKWNRPVDLLKMDFCFLFQFLDDFNGVDRQTSNKDSQTIQTATTKTCGLISFMKLCEKKLTKKKANN